MKRIITATLCAIGLLLGTSCEKDFEEINKNPNNPEDYLSYALFSAANRSLLFNTRYDGNSASLMRSWIQYTAKTVYTDQTRYRVSETDGEYIWFYLYRRMNNYKQIIDMNTDPAKKAESAVFGENANQIAASRIMLSYGFALIVETFGDIPYYSYGGANNPRFQALDVDRYITPVYASQKEIYLDILKELKEAVDMTVGADNAVVFTQGDLVFGSVGKMKRFANSLRLRIANHLKNVNDAELKAAALDVVNHYVSGNESELLQPGESVELEFENSFTYPSPFYYDYIARNRLDYSPSNTFVKFLLGNNKKANDRGTVNFGIDPRLTKICAPIGISKYQAQSGDYTEYDVVTNPADSIHYKGMPYGMIQGTTSNQFKGGQGVSLFSSKLLQATAPEAFMDYSEVCFILSEIRGWNQTWYENGVKASMDKWGVSVTQRDAFVAAMPAASEETVMTQKYVSLFMNPNEGWTEYRRTGYPKFLIATNQRVRTNNPISGDTGTDWFYTFTSMESAIQRIPDRISYPSAYTGVNRQNYLDALQNMGMTANEDLSSGRTKKLIFAENRPD